MLRQKMLSCLSMCTAWSTWIWPIFLSSEFWLGRFLEPEPDTEQIRQQQPPATIPKGWERQRSQIKRSPFSNFKQCKLILFHSGLFSLLSKAFLNESQVTARERDAIQSENGKLSQFINQGVINVYWKNFIFSFCYN